MLILEVKVGSGSLLNANHICDSSDFVSCFADMIYYLLE